MNKSAEKKPKLWSKGPKTNPQSIAYASLLHGEPRAQSVVLDATCPTHRGYITSFYVRVKLFNEGS